MNEIELKKVLREHALWLAGKGNKRANLTGANLAGANLARAYLAGANLTGAYLVRANLAGANLTGANLARAYLAGANLTGAYLVRANLAGANLTRANLTGAYLTGADISGIRLQNATGDGNVIRTMQLVQYTVTVCDDWLQIGCKGYRIHEWEEFSDDEIFKMDDVLDALAFWRKNKALIMAFAEAE